MRIQRTVVRRRAAVLLARAVLVRRYGVAASAALTLGSASCMCRRAVARAWSCGEQIVVVLAREGTACAVASSWAIVVSGERSRFVLIGGRSDSLLRLLHAADSKLARCFKCA